VSVSILGFPISALNNCELKRSFEIFKIAEIGLELDEDEPPPKLDEDKPPPKLDEDEPPPKLDEDEPPPKLDEDEPPPKLDEDESLLAFFIGGSDVFILNN